MDQILPDVQCLVCTRPFFLESDMTDSLESLAICRECKLMVSNSITQQIEHTAPSRYLHPNRHRRSRSRQYNSRHTHTESLDDSDPDSFALAFSQLISSARQSQNSTPNRSNRWPAQSSENESDTHDVMDVSNFGESESNMSFGGYGGDSDASFDRHSVADREIFLQFNNEFSNSPDIDPMRAGLHVRWDSDEEDEDVSEWEEVSERDETAGFTVETPLRRTPLFPDSSPYHEESPSPGPSPIPQWMPSRWQMGPLEIEIRQPFVGDPLDYVDEVAIQFEDILEQLADETDDVRRGAAPTSAKYREKLPRVVVTQEHVRDKDGLICAVCKDPMHINCRALQLPCKHMYHPACILPWLHTRNTCPVCRYELPCEGPDHDKSRREEMEGVLYDTNGEEIEIEEDGYEEEGEVEVMLVESEHEVGGRVNGRDRAVERSNGGGGVRGGWLFLAAAPIVSLVGIVLVFCFRNSSSGNRAGVNGGDSREGGARPERVSDSSRKRWWSIF